MTGESEIRVPARLCSGKSSLPGMQTSGSSCFVLNLVEGGVYEGV